MGLSYLSVVVAITVLLQGQSLGKVIQANGILNVNSLFEYDCTGKEDGNYPHPTKCTHYVACVAQKYAYEMVCALNHDGNPLHYVQDSGPDPATSLCDYPEVAKCNRNGGCSDQQEILADAPFTYDCSDKQDGNYPHPTKCTHYVACVAQTYAYEMVCALNHDGKPLHYVQDSGPNPATSRCDYPEVANCSRDCQNA